MTVKRILLILNILALIGTLIWLKTDQSWEPLVGTITLIGTLIAQLFGSEDRKFGDKTKMVQKGGKNSKNFQSKGDININ